MDLIGSVFFLRGRSMDRSLNCSRFITTSPQLFRKATMSSVCHCINVSAVDLLSSVPINSPLTSNSVLHLKLHVDGDGAGVDA